MGLFNTLQLHSLRSYLPPERGRSWLRLAPDRGALFVSLNRAHYTHSFERNTKPCRSQAFHALLLRLLRLHLLLGRRGSRRLRFYRRRGALSAKGMQCVQFYSKAGCVRDATNSPRSSPHRGPAFDFDIFDFDIWASEATQRFTTSTLQARPWRSKGDSAHVTHTHTHTHSHGTPTRHTPSKQCAPPARVVRWRRPSGRGTYEIAACLGPAPPPAHCADTDTSDYWGSSLRPRTSNPPLKGRVYTRRCALP